jgi:hypothetical protein
MCYCLISSNVCNHIPVVGFTLSSFLIFENINYLLYSLSSRLALLSLKLLLKGRGALLYLPKVLAIQCSRIHLSVFSNRVIMIWA